MTTIQQNSSTGCPFVDPLGIYSNTIYTGKLKLDRKVHGIWVVYKIFHLARCREAAASLSGTICCFQTRSSGSKKYYFSSLNIAVSIAVSIVSDLAVQIVFHYCCSGARNKMVCGKLLSPRHTGRPLKVRVLDPTTSQAGLQAPFWILALVWFRFSDFSEFWGCCQKGGRLSQLESQKFVLHLSVSRFGSWEFIGRSWACLLLMFLTAPAIEISKIFRK